LEASNLNSFYHFCALEHTHTETVKSQKSRDAVEQLIPQSISGTN